VLPPKSRKRFFTKNETFFKIIVSYEKTTTYPQEDTIIHTQIGLPKGPSPLALLYVVIEGYLPPIHDSKILE
jgi:hypothetical protein